ncbi:interleukin-1 beta [Hemicordylus capensis]|uniref:interleukin-1 beta n=1 Tax=Hemicordylus capensis TaxID=884348 RepID=UPI0023027A72|nr:interleukin-1 beta [Hemicordylus capensis]
MAVVPLYPEEMMELSSSYSENEMQFYIPEVDRPFLTKNAFLDLKHCACSPRDFSACEMGVQVEVAEPASVRSFRKAVVIVVAVGKMRKNTKARSFTDEDLMDILNSILEPVDLDTDCEGTFAGNGTYRFTRAISYEIQDQNKRHLVLNQPAQLVAMHLQGANISHAVRLEMSVYLPKMEPGAVTNPVALGIKGENLCLSCVQKGEKPVLQLETQKASILKDLDRAQLGRFLFSRIHCGGRCTRFESAAFPGWFICTSAQDNQAVGVTDQLGAATYTGYELLR